MSRREFVVERLIITYTYNYSMIIKFVILIFPSIVINGREYVILFFMKGKTCVSESFFKFDVILGLPYLIISTFFEFVNMGRF